MQMNKGLTSIIATAAIGVVAATAYMASSEDMQRQRQTRKIKRTASKAIRNAGIVLDGVTQLMQ